MGHPYCGFSVVLPKVTLQSLPILSPLIPDPHSLCPSLLLRCQVLFCVSLSVSRLLRLNHCHSHELCDFSARQTLTCAPLDDALHLCGRPERLQPPHSFRATCYLSHLRCYLLVLGNRPSVNIKEGYPVSGPHLPQREKPSPRQAPLPWSQ